MYYVYLLQGCGGRKIYVGLTDDLSKRISEHRNGKSRVTRSWLPIKLIWYCVFLDKHAAAAFEQYLKSGSGREFARRHRFYIK